VPIGPAFPISNGMILNKKKVFICITKSNWGGAQKYVFDIATSINRELFDISILLGGNGELKKRLEEKNIRIIELENSQRDIKTKKDFGLFFELYTIFRKEKPDIIHLNSSKMGFIGVLTVFVLNLYFKLTSKNYKLKAIFTAHGWSFNENRNFLSKLFFKVIHIMTIIMSHQTIVVAEILKNQIPKIFRKKIVVIKNGISEIDFIEREIAKEKLFGRKLLIKDKIFVGTISELHKNKGLTYIIEAISKTTKNIIFLIIGEGEERHNLEILIKKLGAENKIFLIGKIEEASRYLKAFDIFTLTSITEAFPYVLLEAGLASLPVIASNVGGIPEIIENGQTGILIQPRNSEEIKDKIEEIAKNIDKYSFFGKNLKEKIEKEFTKEKMIEKTFLLYNK
jgi:glycosyltransferase involved in cell wall biosynthesis